MRASRSCRGEHHVLERPSACGRIAYDRSAASGTEDLGGRRYTQVFDRKPRAFTKGAPSSHARRAATLSCEPMSTSVRRSGCRAGVCRPGRERRDGVAESRRRCRGRRGDRRRYAFEMRAEPRFRVLRRRRFADARAEPDLLRARARIHNYQATDSLGPGFTAARGFGTKPEDDDRG